MEIDFNLPLFLLGLIILLLIARRTWRCSHSLGKCGALVLLGIYLMFVIRETLFPIDIDPWRRSVMQEAGVDFWDRINWIPFYFGPFTSWRTIEWNMGLNSLLSLPFGLLIGFYRPVTWKRMAVYSLAFGLIIEAVQLIIGLLLGYPYRVTDINDVLANAAGVWLGFGLFLLSSHVLLWLTRGPRWKNNRLHKYIEQAVHPQK